MILKMFKAKKQTKRFRKNQRVWVVLDCANHAYIKFKWQGKGRYVNGIIAKGSSSNKYKWNTVIGEDGFKEIDVQEIFAKRILEILEST